MSNFGSVEESIFPVFTLQYFKEGSLWSPLALLLGEIYICAHRLFYTAFNAQQLLFEAFSHITCVFGSVEPWSESTFPFLYIIIFQRWQSLDPALFLEKIDICAYWLFSTFSLHVSIDAPKMMKNNNERMRRRKIQSGAWKMWWNKDCLFDWMIRTLIQWNGSWELKIANSPFHSMYRNILPMYWPHWEVYFDLWVQNWLSP